MGSASCTDNIQEPELLLFGKKRVRNMDGLKWSRTVLKDRKVSQKLIRRSIICSHLSGLLTLPMYIYQGTLSRYGNKIR